uniref:ditrans,polycis-polyprenyl diphosphate synthase [(2E,6E)-farnesyldiphosphate specific] n=1 Tax=Ananas comosus var. bracteatus TaxID=296719 RepID=A0A6V7PH37_ANACO|nr:unnamed protein product [Ananas comosus var. bracteatus]
MDSYFHSFLISWSQYFFSPCCGLLPSLLPTPAPVPSPPPSPSSLPAARRTPSEAPSKKIGFFTLRNQNPPLSPLRLSNDGLVIGYRHLANEFARTFEDSIFHDFEVYLGFVLVFTPYSGELGAYLVICDSTVAVLHHFKWVVCKVSKFLSEPSSYLAVVVDSQEAKHTAKIKQLLSWLSAIGVKHVALYDAEGVLKKSIDFGQTRLRDRSAGTCLDGDVNCVTSRNYEEMSIELLSFTDEANMTKALKAVGYYGPEPDLLLVYGLARCHLGFPPWRLRYTEIMHMGPLKSMKYSAIVKALYDFSKKYQNYGS